MISEIKRMLEAGEVVELECIDLSNFLTEELNCKTRYNKKCMAEFNSLVDEASDVGVTMEDGFFIDEEELRYFKIKEKQEQDMSYSEKLVNKDVKFQEMLAVASNAVDKGVLSCFTVSNMNHSDKIGNALYLGLNMTYHAIENEIKGIEKMMDENKTVEQEVKKPTFDDLIDYAVKAVRDGEIHKFIFNKCLSNKDIIWLYTHKDESKHFKHDQAQCGIDFINSLYTESFVIDKECLMPKVKDEAKVTLSNGNSFIARKVEHSFVVMKDGSEVKSLMFKDHNDFWVTYSFFELKGAAVTQQKGNNSTAFNLEAFKSQAYTAMTKNLDQDTAKFNEGNK